MHAAINGLGALATAVVTVIHASTKFLDGAWIVIVLMPILIVIFVETREHYRHVARSLTLDGYRRLPIIEHRVVVPVGGVHQATLRAVDYARQIATDVTAVYVNQEGDAHRVLSKWAEWQVGIPLVVLEAPYRSLTRPLLDYIDALSTKLGEQGVLTVVLPEFIPRSWWHHLLHNQSALMLKAALLFRRNVVVVDVPFHLAR